MWTASQTRGTPDCQPTPSPSPHSAHARCDWVGLAHKMAFFSSTSAKTRQGALESLRLALAAHLLPDFLLERCLTLADALEKCLKKGWAWEPVGGLNWLGANPCLHGLTGRHPCREGRGTGPGRCRARSAVCAAGPWTQGGGVIPQPAAPAGLCAH